MLSVFWAVLQRDLLISLRQRGTLVHHLLFMALVVVLFPLGAGSERSALIAVAPALIWMAVLLSVLLSLQRLFRADLEDGTLAQYMLSPEPLAWIVLAKVVAYWLTSGLLFVLLAPCLVLLLGVPAQSIGVMMAALLLGTPVLSLVGAVGAALTLSLPGAGLLLALLLFPLYVPVMIFGAGAMHASIIGVSVAGPLYFLAAVLLLSLTLAPWAIAAALRISVE